MSNSSSDTDVCRSCGGKKADHFNPDGSSKTIHEFTLIDGHLAPPPLKPKASSMAAINLSDPATLQRLVGVMLEKNLLSTDDVLYIAGFRSPHASDNSARGGVNM